MIRFNLTYLKIALFLSAIFFLVNNLTGQRLIELLPGSDKLIINTSEEYQKLIGNVRFKYQGHLMYCDSALFYDKTGEVYAYSRVHINKKDTLNLFCDSLYYNSTTKKAKLWGNVRVRDREYKLETDTMEYDAAQSAAIYRHGGTITHIQRSDQLTSQVGYYYPDSKNFFFRKDVVFDDEKYHVVTDTMKFNSIQEQLFFFGKTHIHQKEDTTDIFCHKGYFNMANNEGEFIDSAEIHRPGQLVTGDTLRYRSEDEISIGIGNVRIRDSVENVEFRSHYMYSNGLERTKLLTDKAYAIFFQEEDTTYINADTLFAVSDSLDEIETMKAYYKVKIFSTKYQGVCDSLTYSGTDSLLRLYSMPVLWNDNNQLNGDFITVKRDAKHIKHARIEGKALSVSELDSGLYYNQVSGREMDGYFKDGDLHLLHVQGNAKTLYFPEEEKENDTAVVVTRSGMNKLVSSEMKLYLDSGEVVGLTNFDNPEGVFYGMEKIPGNELKTEHFIWHSEIRPKRPELFTTDTTLLTPLPEETPKESEETQSNSEATTQEEE